MMRFFGRAVLMLTVITTFSIAAARGIGAFVPMGRTMATIDALEGAPYTIPSLIDLDRCLIHRLTLPHSPYELRLSPNHQQLAYRISRDNQSDLFIFNWVDQTVTQVTDNTLRESLPAWSSDSEQLIYVRGDIPEYTQLIVYTLSSGRTDAVSPILESSSLLDLSWSSDGDTIAASAYSGSVHIFNIRTNANLQIDDSHTVYQALGWSPDGQYLLTMRSRGTTDLMRFDVYADTSEVIYTGEYGSVKSAWWLSDEVIGYLHYDPGDQWNTLILRANGQHIESDFSCAPEYVYSFDIVP